MATGKALVDVECGELKFWVNNEEVTFNVCQSMKRPTDLHVVSVVDVVDEAVASVWDVANSSITESLAAVLLNYEKEEISDYEEVVAALSGDYVKKPFKLDIDLKNRASPPAKP